MPAGTELSAQDKAVIALAFNNPTVGLNVVQWLEGIDSLSATELAYIDGVTAGTAAASKALVLNSSGGIATITSATITTLTSSSIVSGAGNGAVGSSVAAAETGDGVTHKTVLTLAIAATTLTDAAEFIAPLLYTFPVGRILILGVTANAVLEREDANISATAEGDYSLGTTATVDKTLDGTDVNLLPSTAWTVASNEAPLTGALAASAQFDGTSTAAKMYLNLMIDTGDISGDASISITGTITITWANLGDY